MQHGAYSGAEPAWISGPRANGAQTFVVGPILAGVEDGGVLNDVVAGGVSNRVTIGVHGVDVDLLRPRVRVLAFEILAVELVLWIEDVDRGVRGAQNLDRDVGNLVEAHAVKATALS